MSNWDLWRSSKLEPFTDTKTFCLWTVVIWIIFCNISDILPFFLITWYYHPPYLLPSVTSTSSIIPLCAIGVATTLTGQGFWWSWSKDPPNNAWNQLSRYETPVKQFGMDLAILSYFCHIGLKSERHHTKTCIIKALAHCKDSQQFFNKNNENCHNMNNNFLNSFKHYIELLRKLLQLWQKFVMHKNDDYIFCIFSCSMRGPLSDDHHFSRKKSIGKCWGIISSMVGR